MREPVRNLKGEPKGMVGKLNFTPGDLVAHRKHHNNTLIYYIAGVGEHNGYTSYRYFCYKNEPFENHHGSGWKKADYFDKRFETAGAEQEWIDYDMGDYEHYGHVKEKVPFIEIGRSESYTLAFDRLNSLLSDGYERIGAGVIFYETVGSGNYYMTMNNGAQTEGLADDMLRLRDDNGDEKSFVEHKERVMEAIERGIWLPIKQAESKVKGMRVSKI